MNNIVLFDVFDIYRELLFRFLYLESLMIDLQGRVLLEPVSGWPFSSPVIRSISTLGKHQVFQSTHKKLQAAA